MPSATFVCHFERWEAEPFECGENHRFCILRRDTALVRKVRGTPAKRPAGEQKRRMIARTQMLLLSVTLNAPVNDILLGKLSASGVIFPADEGTPAVGAGLIKIPFSGKAGAFRTGALILER